VCITFCSVGFPEILYVITVGRAREKRNCCSKSKGDQDPHSFSPDGQRLAFSEVGANTGDDLWTLPLARPSSDARYCIECDRNQNRLISNRTALFHHG
jgi:hypothetical protein